MPAGRGGYIFIVALADCGIHQIAVGQHQRQGDRFVGRREGVIERVKLDFGGAGVGLDCDAAAEAAVIHPVAGGAADLIDHGHAGAWRRVEGNPELAHLAGAVGRGRLHCQIVIGVQCNGSHRIAAHPPEEPLRRIIRADIAEPDLVGCSGVLDDFAQFPRSPSHLGPAFELVVTWGSAVLVRTSQASRLVVAPLTTLVRPMRRQRLVP